MVFNWIIIFFILLLVLSTVLFTKKIIGGRANVNLLEFFKDNAAYVTSRNEHIDIGYYNKMENVRNICYAGITKYYINLESPNIRILKFTPQCGGLLNTMTPVEINYHQIKYSNKDSILSKISEYIQNLINYKNAIIIDPLNARLNGCGDESKLFTHRYNCTADFWINRYLNQTVKLYTGTDDTLNKIAYIIHVSAKIIYSIAYYENKKSKFKIQRKLIIYFMSFIANIIKINGLNSVQDYGMPFLSTQLLDRDINIFNYIIIVTRHVCVLHFDFVKHGIITYHEVYKKLNETSQQALFVEKFKLYSNFYKAINSHDCGKNIMFSGIKNKLLNVYDDICSLFNIGLDGSITNCTANVRRLIMLFGVHPDDSNLKIYIRSYYGDIELRNYETEKDNFKHNTFLALYAIMPPNHLYNCNKCENKLHEYNLMYHRIMELGVGACNREFFIRYGNSIKTINNDVYNELVQIEDNQNKTTILKSIDNLFAEKSALSDFDFVDGYLLFLIFLYYKTNNQQLLNNHI